MNKTQWLFEFYALKEKEKETTDLIMEMVKIHRRVLIDVLGLNLLQEDNFEEDPTGEVESYAPLSLLVGRREMAEAMVEKMKQRDLVRAAIDDDAFEQMSQQIASEDIGDMEPIFDDSDTNEEIQAQIQANHARMLQQLGINITSRDRKSAVHINFDKEEIINNPCRREVSKTITTLKLDDDG